MTSPAALAPTRLVDQFHRSATDLRISLLDKCNLRCSYCMPAEGLPWMGRDQLLTVAEIVRLAKIGVRDLQVRSIRLTGGEPLVRAELVEIVTELARLRSYNPDLNLALTSNAIGLEKVAVQLAAAGLNRVNLSVDTIDPAKYREITRRDRLDAVLRGVAAAQEAGLEPVKINTVAIRGFTDIAQMTHWALANGLELRFIEHMPLGPPATWDRDSILGADQIEAVWRDLGELSADGKESNSPARKYRLTLPSGQSGSVGIIASVTRPFCASCDRTRITADGKVRSCLFSHEETDLRALLRGGATDAEIITAWAGAHWRKPAAHGIGTPGFQQPSRTMSAIGG